jgi:hypothetical protein
MSISSDRALRFLNKTAEELNSVPLVPGQFIIVRGEADSDEGEIYYDHRESNGVITRVNFTSSLRKKIEELDQLSDIIEVY